MEGLRQNESKPHRHSSLLLCVCGCVCVCVYVCPPLLLSIPVLMSGKRTQVARQPQFSFRRRLLCFTWSYKISVGCICVCVQTCACFISQLFEQMGFFFSFFYSLQWPTKFQSDVLKKEMEGQTLICMEKSYTRGSEVLYNHCCVSCFEYEHLDLVHVIFV